MIDRVGFWGIWCYFEIESELDKIGEWWYFQKMSVFLALLVYILIIRNEIRINLRGCVSIPYFGTVHKDAGFCLRRGENKSFSSVHFLPPYHSYCCCCYFISVAHSAGEELKSGTRLHTHWGHNWIRFRD